MTHNFCKVLKEISGKGKSPLIFSKMEISGEITVFSILHVVIFQVEFAQTIFAILLSLLLSDLPLILDKGQKPYCDRVWRKVKFPSPLPPPPPEH